MIYACCLVYFLILASHSCIIVTEPSEVEPVEPEPGIPFVVEPEVNPGKQLSITRGMLSGKHVLTLIWMIMTGGSFKIVSNWAVLTDT